MGEPCSYLFLPTRYGKLVCLSLHLIFTLCIEPKARRKHVASLGMAVSDDHQGQGVGTQLLESVIDLAENWLNIQRMELTVFTDNEAGVSLL